MTDIDALTRRRAPVLTAAGGPRSPGSPAVPRSTSPPATSRPSSFGVATSGVTGTLVTWNVVDDILAPPASSSVRVPEGRRGDGDTIETVRRTEERPRRQGVTVGIATRRSSDGFVQWLAVAGVVAPPASVR